MHFDRAEHIMAYIWVVIIRSCVAQETGKPLHTVMAFDTVHLFQDVTFRILHLPVRTIDPRTLESVNGPLIALADRFGIIKSTKKVAFIRKLQAKIGDMAAVDKNLGGNIPPRSRFTRNIWGDILSTGLKIVSEVVPNYYIKAMIKSIRTSLLEKDRGEHFLSTHLDKKLRRINDQLNSLKGVSTVQKMDAQLSEIGRKIYTYERHQLFLKL